MIIIKKNILGLYIIINETIVNIIKTKYYTLIRNKDRIEWNLMK
jgi:hypothetical protein